jgi:glyoxylase-like metal-dependent hydrolase (beta-lactamase superfamily II)
MRMTVGAMLMTQCLLGVSWGAAAADVVRYASGEKGFAVNSWLVPTTTGVVVIDTQFTVPEAENLARAVTNTGRPLKGIIVTHPHPDHFNGVCRLLQLGRVPVYANRATIDGIQASADAKRAQWKPVYGADYPDRTCAPDAVAPNDGALLIDDTAFEIHDFGGGEAVDESVVIVPQLKAAFVGDLIYRNVHPWLAEGRSALWLQQLDRLANVVPQDFTIYPGHGTAGGTAVIAAQRQYITEFRAATKAKLGPSGLSSEAAAALAQEARAQYPGWPLEMLIPINASAVATELSTPLMH